MSRSDHQNRRFLAKSEVSLHPISNTVQTQFFVDLSRTFRGPFADLWSHVHVATGICGHIAFGPLYMWPHVATCSSGYMYVWPHIPVATCTCGHMCIHKTFLKPFPEPFPCLSPTILPVILGCRAKPPSLSQAFPEHFPPRKNLSRTFRGFVLDN